MMVHFYRLRILFPIAMLFATMLPAAMAQQSIGELYASDASVKGSVILAGSGTTVLSGSSIEAGAQAATLKLERGGNVRVCEGTKLSVTDSQNGRELLLSLSSGNVELNYPLGTEADTLLTPDLRLLLPGPGTVHVAVRVTPMGDTCVQSLASNVASIVVSETMGDATYQVKPDEAVLFRGGRLGDSSKSNQNCGCPAPPPIHVATAVPPPVQPQPAQPVASAPIPPAPPEQHLAVAAPFVFRADDPVPDLTENVATLRLENNKFIQLDPTVLPPAHGKKAPPAPAQSQSSQTAEKNQSHGFFSKVGSFFASIFH